MSPEEFQNAGQPIGTSSEAFLGGGGFKIIRPNSTGKDIALGIAKGATQMLYDSSAFKAGPVGKAMLDSAPGLKKIVQEQVEPGMRADNTTQQVAKFGTELASPFIAGKAVSLARAGVKLTTEGATAAKEVASKTGSYTSGRVPKLLGIFTGESDDVVRNALRNPELADTGIEGGDDALRAVVREGSENTIKIRNAFIQGHKEAKAQVLGQYAGILEPKNNVVGVFNKLLEKNGVKVTKEGLDFTTSKIIANPGEVGKIKDAYAALKKWDKFTIDSLDEYKQLVGKLTRFADEAGVPSRSPLLGSLYNELNEIALKRLPKDVAKNYSSLNSNFHQQIELYDDLVDAFNSGDPFTKLANALGKNKDTLRQVLEFYAKQEGGLDVLPVVAGRELAMEKTAAFGFLNPRSWIDLLISPKVQAKLTTKLGRILPKQGQ